ncbi:MAG: DegV family protein [Dehalococcoidia bacterium]
MAVKVVTDSTADLPDEVVKSLGITVVPLCIHFGEQTYFDGLDLRADEFYQKLGQSESLPTTSQPAPAAFAEIYTRLSDEADGIISIHISPKLSGTYNSAVLAREAAPEHCPIEIIDSCHASMGLGLIVIQAAMAAQSGGSLDDVKEVVRDVIPRTHFWGMVDTLEYLHKGGRIGRAQTLMGTLLSIKPLLCVKDGEVHPRGKARTRKKAMDRVLEIVQDFPDIEQMTVLHSTTPDEAAAFIEKISPIFRGDKIYSARIGPVIGTYLGPGSLAVGIIEKGVRTC